MEAGARVIHVDVMDGHFVPVITFGPKMLADVADVIHDHDGFADVHLMIERPSATWPSSPRRAPTASRCTSRPARTSTTRCR